MSEKIKVVMAGTGGYGAYYLEELFHKQEKGDVMITGAVDPYSRRSIQYQRMRDKGIPVFSRLEEYFERHSCDLAVISSPIHFHAAQTCEALRNQSHVLCDKPLCALVRDAHSIIRCRDLSGRRVLVGYQWSYSQAVRELKTDILNGVWGAPLRLKTICLWPRGREYYNRNDWAGRIKTDDGDWVLDSPVHNAMAHFLHNMLYLTGERMDSSAAPASITGELYRANPVENYDTAACRIRLENKADCLFLVSHAAEKEIGPCFHFEFENGVIEYSGPEPGITGKDRRGNVRRYGNPDAEGQFYKLTRALAAVRKDIPVICGPEAALPQVICVNGLQKAFPLIPDFPPEFISEIREEERIYVKGLGDVMSACFRDGCLPHDTGVSWSRPGKTGMLARELS